MADTSVASATPPDLLDALQSAFQTSVKNVTSLGGLLGDKVSGESADSGSIGTAENKQGIQQQSIAEQGLSDLKGQATAKAQADDARVAAASNVTTDAMVQRSKDISGRVSNLKTMDDQLISAAGQTVFNDPINWIKNQFTVPAIQSQRDATAQALTLEAAALDKQQQTTTNSFQINSTLDAATGAQVDKLNKDLIASQTLQQKGAADLKAASMNNEAMQVNASLDEHQFNLAYKVMGASADAANEARQQAGFDITTGGKLGRQAMTNFKLDELKKSQDNLNVVSSYIGRADNPLTSAEISSMPSQQKGAMERIMNSILVDKSLGITPVDAVANAAAAGVKPATAGEAQVAKLISDTYSSYMNMHKGIQGPENRQFAKDQVNTQLGGIAGQAATAVNPIGGIYSPAPLASTLKIPMVLASPIGRSMLPMTNPGNTDNPNYPTDFNDVWATAKDLIQNGDKDGNKFTAAQMATNISMMAKQVQAQTNLARNFRKYQMPEFGPGVGQINPYNATVKVYSGLGSKTVDMTNKAKVETELIRDISNEKNFGFSQQVLKDAPAF